MGTKVAPSLANIFMADFEEKYVYSYPDQPLLWRRFIDACVMVWCPGREKLDEFINHLNSCHPTIKFTAEISDCGVNFLDTTIHLEKDGSLWTNLYYSRDPTDSHDYLLFSSAHPYHCKKSLPSVNF